MWTAITTESTIPNGYPTRYFINIIIPIKEIHISVWDILKTKKNIFSIWFALWKRYYIE